MRVGIMGFGKTGKAVASVLLESKMTNLQWVLRQSPTSNKTNVPEFLGIHSDEPGKIYSINEWSIEELLAHQPVDFIIDFSSEHGLDYYGKAAAERNIGIISAVSHYSKEQTHNLYELSKNTIVMHSPNITLGVNFLIIAAKILKKIAPYTDIAITEEHFSKKPEVSGTAKVIAQELDISHKEINSIRAGGIVGIHEILFGFPYQTVRLKHESISREAFGNGILFALQNLHGKPKGLYNMENLLTPYFNVE